MDVAALFVREFLNICHKSFYKKLTNQDQGRSVKPKDIESTVILKRINHSARHVINITARCSHAFFS